MLETLFEDEQIVAVHRSGNSAATLITFADLTARPAPGWFWGRRPVEQLDLDCIGLIAKQPNWYPEASMLSAAQAIRQAGRPTRIGYGYSMGAYAALKYGALLGLDAALSISPQISIDPTDVPGDRRFRQHFKPEYHRGMRIAAADLPRWSAVLADPYDVEDRLHMDALPVQDSLHRLPTPFMGHWTIWLLTGTEALAEALACIAEHDAAGLHRVLRRQRARAPVWLRRVGEQALRQGREHLSETLFARAAALGLSDSMLAESRAMARLARAKVLHARGQSVETLVRQAVADLPEDAQVLDQAGHALLAMRHVAAAPIFTRALAIAPDNASAAFGLSHALFNAGDRAGALVQAQTALQHRPDDSELLTWLGNVLAGADPGNGAAAEPFFRAACAITPDLRHAHLGLANVLCMQRRFAEALAVLRGAAQLWPLDPGIERMIERVKKLRWRRLIRRMVGRARAAPSSGWTAPADILTSLRDIVSRLQADGQQISAAALADSLVAITTDAQGVHLPEGTATRPLHRPAKQNEWLAPSGPR